MAFRKGGAKAPKIKKPKAPRPAHHDPAAMYVHPKMMHTGLTSSAHHGVTAHTHHGPGGMKPHEMKVPKVPQPKSGLKMHVHKAGKIKIPRLHAPRPGKGTHNHIKKV